MKKTKQDVLLTLLDRGQSLSLEQKDDSILEELEEKGLVEKGVENSYNLTSYGEMIKVMGYKTYEAAEEFEKKIPAYSPGKTKLLRTILLVVLNALLATLLLIFIMDLEQVILGYVCSTSSFSRL